MGLKLIGVRKAFPAQGQRPAVGVLGDIDLNIDNGRFLAVVGPSGCGKTTLLRIIAGLEPASAGSVVLGGEAIQDHPGRVGLVFQDYALFPWRTALGNIEMGPRLQGMEPGESKRMAKGLMQAFGLEGFEDSYPNQLSGGMQQRVAIARTLIMEPEVVLMDEPFGALDSQTRNALQEFLLEIWGQRRDTIIFVTHNVDEAVFMADEILVLSARPARVVERIAVDAPRPRDRTSAECNQIRRHVLALLKDQQTNNNHTAPH